MKAVVLNPGAPPQGGASPYALKNMESLINKFTSKCNCFYNVFNVRGAWNRGQLLNGGVVGKRLGTAAVKCDDVASSRQNFTRVWIFSCVFRRAHDQSHLPGLRILVFDNNSSSHLPPNSNVARGCSGPAGQDVDDWGVEEENRPSSPRPLNVT